MKSKVLSGLLAANLVLISIVIFLKLENPRYTTMVKYSYPKADSSYKEEKPENVPVNTNVEEMTEAQPQQERFQEPAEVAVVNFPLELNSATAEELMLVPKIGSVTSQRIVQYRQHLGGYTDLTQLMEIKGIGKGTYEEISVYLYLEDGA